MTRSNAWLVLVMIAACGDHARSRGPDPAHSAGARRDISELERIERTPRSCEEHADCPTGSHCDEETGACAWSCLGDSECGPGKECDLYGSCVLALDLDTATNSPGCVGGDPAVQGAALIRLYQDAQNGTQFACATDICPCGSHCSSATAVCEVECLAPSMSPPPELQCPSGMTCDPLGSCVTGTPPPPPPVVLTLGFSDITTAANTATAAVVKQINVTASATSLSALSLGAPAVVTFSIADAAPTPAPRVKCAASDPLAASCQINGGWVFDFTSGKLQSLPKPIWVEIPQTTTEKSWTLEARSAMAVAAATDTIRAEPAIIPATDPGHYKGTLTLPNRGAPTGDHSLAVPVEAIVTPTHVAVFEPTHVMFPDGHAVLARDMAKATLLGWLDTTGASYDVALGAPSLTYTATTGHLAASFTISDGSAAMPTTASLALDRTGNVDATACPCGSGSYCNTAMNLCLPGAGPPSGGGIVPVASAFPSQTLPSTTIALWATPLTQLATSFPGQLGNLEGAYCYRAANGSLPAALNADPTDLDQVSGDLKCAAGAIKYAEPAFPFENLDREYVTDTSGGTTFDLFESCKADLDAQPTGAVTPANLLGDRTCASVGRFLLALRANSGVSPPDLTQRVVHNVLRQWLGANAYVASTAVKDRQYDDALSASSQPAQDLLGNALAQVDRGLRVLLDPTVRPQYAGGSGLASVLAAPDYRIKPRPISRWSFTNASPGVPVPDAEGSTPFMATGSVVMSALNDLEAFYPRTTAPTCGTTLPVALEDRAFTLAFELHYTAANVATTVLFDKLASNGDRLWLEASTTDHGAHLNLTLKDSHGGVAVFPPVVQGFLAITVDGSLYRAYVAPKDMPAIEYVATSVTGGGPRWGAAGPVSLACDIPVIPGSCTSWDRNLPGDGLDVVVQAPYVDRSAKQHYSCTEQLVSPYSTTCTGPQPNAAYCNTQANAYRNQVIQGLFPNPPTAAVNALTVAGQVFVEATGSSSTKVTVTTWTDFHCNFTITNRPTPVTAVKPVCTQERIRWDEVSLWNRPVTPAELTAMSARYQDLPSNETLPPKLLPAFGTDQAIGLPVHMLEAASADLDLLTAYIAAEQAAVYQQCALGGPPPPLDQAAANLRLVSLIESEAERLVSLAPTAPWRARYDAAHQALAARRTKAFEALERVSQCKNPLGIGEENVPLFIGETVTDDTNKKFYASSIFLASKAKEEIAIADSKLATARQHYIDQRLSAFQLSQFRESKTTRISKLRSDAESALIHFCGQPAGTQKLLDGFIAGTTTSSNCYIKTELPECVNLTNVTLANAPASCLRGELGSRLLAIKTADVEMANAANALTRAMDEFDSASAYCARRKIELAQDYQLYQKHNEHMASLRRQAQHLKHWYSLLHTFSAFASQNFVGGFFDLMSLQQSLLGDDLQNAEADEATRYGEITTLRAHDMDIELCLHNADNQKFAIDAARDVIKRARQQVIDATFELDSTQNQITGIIGEAIGQIALENSLTSTPPHLHYWLDTDIIDYHRHLEYARRLTYLAVRAFEYESQRSSGYRTTTLTARRPEDLTSVVTAIDGASAPGQSGLVIGPRRLVLSVRDEILHIPAITSAPLPGDPVRTPEQAFHDYMASSSSIILDANGNALGRGIRFSLHPDGWSSTSCAERIWRLLPSLQIDNPPSQHGMVLYQENAFGSQSCSAATGSVTVNRADPSQNLLTGDSALFGTPSPTTALNIDGPLGLDRQTLQNISDSSLIYSGLAGRGVYANYVLLFPKQIWPDSEIAKIKDVLLLFDLSELTRP